MKIEYGILWFEDDRGWFEPTKTMLKDYLGNLGFTLKETREEDGRNLDTLLKNMEDRRIDINLILMDFKLVGGPIGDQLIKKIRDHQLFTEIVFYSQDTNVREKIINPEGVFFANRDDLVEKAKKVIDLTIRKVQDLNNLRGLVMAETSDLEKRLLRNVHKMLHDGDQSKISALKAEFHKKAVETREERFKEFGKFHPETDYDKFRHKLEHSEKLRAILRLIKRKLKDGVNQAYADHLTALGTYSQEVIDIRNLLAHVEESIDAKTGRKVLTSSLKNSPPFEFTHDNCTKIRKDIKKHGEMLDEFHENIGK